MPRTLLNADFIEFLRVRLEALPVCAAEAGGDVRQIFRDGVLKRSPADSPKWTDRIQFSLI
ncbi:MAG TPA: hypothetical protein VMV78_14505 [Thiobacillus sp.]|nr:hypothetical protein [Thiobacillus sp.]